MEGSFLDHLIKEAEERAAKYREYRSYYDGDHSVKLTERQRAFLNIGDREFSANYMPIVVDSLAMRLKLKGFDGPLGKTLNEWWELNNMDFEQFGLHVSAIRDGDAGVMVEWDVEEKRPRFIPQLAYDGRDGVAFHYDGGSNDLQAATKRWWTEFGNRAGKIRRMNVYYPDRIERYYTTTEESEHGWLPYNEPGEGSTSDWLFQGQPIGIPIIHFTNRSRGYRFGMSEMEVAIPMQTALDKAVVDLLAAADSSGFRILVMLGDDPSQMKISPGGFIWSRKPPTEVSVDAIRSEEMRPLVETVDSFVQRVGQVSDTPLSYFQLSGQMASEGTHKAHEARMLVKSRSVATELGSAWVKACKMAIRLNNIYGSKKMDEKADIIPVWADFDMREEVDKLKDKAEIVQLLVGAGATIKQAALVAGFSAEQAEKLAEVDLEAVRLLTEAQTPPPPPMQPGQEEESNPGGGNAE